MEPARDVCSALHQQLEHAVRAQGLQEAVEVTVVLLGGQDPGTGGNRPEHHTAGRDGRLVDHVPDVQPWIIGPDGPRTHAYRVAGGP